MILSIVILIVLFDLNLHCYFSLFMTDFDSHIGFWISDLPYVWVPSDVIEECKRYYLLRVKGLELSLFDNHNFMTTDHKTEDLCILPLGNIGTCNLVRNCFLVNDTSLKGEIRIAGAGHAFKKDERALNEDDIINGVVNIIDPDTNYIGVWRYYPEQFAKTIPKDIMATIKLTTQRGTRSFNNIMDAVKVMRIVNKEDYKRIHTEALINLQRELNGHNSSKSSIINKILLDMYPGRKGSFSTTYIGWKYDKHTPLLVAHTQYEILIGEKLEYPLKIAEDTRKNLKFEPVIAGEVVYTNHSLKVAQKITGDRSSSDIDTLLNNFYGKKANLPMWSTNKSPNKSQFKKYIDEIAKYKTHNILKPVYIDIGSGSGEDAIILARELGCENPIFADIKNVVIPSSSGTFIQIVNFEPLKDIQKNSIDFISMFHSLHHMPDAEFRLRNVVNILKSGGFFLLKDHNVLTKEDANNVSFEHFVYSVGEGKARVADKNNYNNIEPMYYFSADQVVNFMKSLGTKLIFISKFNNPIKTYQAMFQKG